MVDLIYANEAKEDIDILHEYNFDLAYGSDENNFELTVPLRDNPIKDKYFIYIENTEYGGIVDAVKADTGSRQIIYSGRTWHGILAGKIIEPDTGCDYQLFAGDANNVLAEIITLAGLTDIFTVAPAHSGIEIQNYECRYQDAYSVIKNMLFRAGGKLKIRHIGTMIELSAVPYIDYSQNEEWDSSQRDFSAERKFRPVNHLICLGSGELKKRHVIHLYADENGGIQPYATRDLPVSDADYILTIQNRQMTGIDEVTEIYDYPNAADTENYVQLQNKPEDFDTNYGSYYIVDDNGDGFEHPEAVTADVYFLLSGKPSDWESNCEAYYTKNGESYSNVQKVTSDVYSEVTNKPADWSKSYGAYYYQTSNGYAKVEGVKKSKYVKVNDKVAKTGWKKKYADYYIRMWDGVQYVYNRVSGVTKYNYVVQTKKPSDWSINFKAYYRKKEKEAGYEALDGDAPPKWERKKYYTAYSYITAPPFNKKETYYLLQNYVEAPDFAAKKVYTVASVIAAPAYTGNTYYYLTNVVYKPQWEPGVYYKLYIDHYADLVAGGLKKMQEYFNCDNIDIQLSPEIDYDIGDVVGARENVTGLSVWQPITKKIVTINKNKISVSHEVGGNV